MNTEDMQENEYLPTIQDHIAVSKILAFDLKQIKKEISLYGVSWIKDLGKKNKEKYWPNECVYWNSAKVQVVKSKEEAVKSAAANIRRRTRK